MSLITRRIFMECLKIFFISTTILLVFILMGRALQLREMLVGLELGFLETLQLFIYLTPSFLSMMAPISAMLAVFLTFLRMGMDRELVALHAGGVSLYQLLYAPIAFGVLCSLIMLWVSIHGIAWGMGNFRSFILDIPESRFNIVLQAGTFNKDIPNMVFYAKKVDAQNGTLADVMIEDSSREDLPIFIMAQSGTIDTDIQQGELIVLLKDGNIYSESSGQITKLSFEEYVVRFSLDSLFQGLDLGAVKPKEMHWNELRSLDLEEIYEQSPRLANKILVEQHKRILFPISCLVLTLFAIPVANSFQGVQRQRGLMISLVFFLIYYVLVFMGIRMGESEELDPRIGIWTPVLLFTVLGIWGIYLSANERMFSLLTPLKRMMNIVKRTKNTG